MWKLLVQTPLPVNPGIGTTSLCEVPSNLEVKIRIKKCYDQYQMSEAILLTVI